MSIDPEKLLALAEQLQDPDGVTLDWPLFVSIVDELREFQADWLLKITSTDCARAF